jgi:TetR/AcrR family transcriptional regulator, cholesterol catabolism regulator
VRVDGLTAYVRVLMLTMVNFGHGSSIRPGAAAGADDAPAGPAPGGRRLRRKREVYQRIRDAALDLFRQQGYEATTVEAIAERADVAKGTVFNYFRHKQALLTAIAGERMEQLACELGPPADWRGCGEEKLRRLFLKLAESTTEDRDLSKVMFFENMRNLWLRSTDARHLWVQSQEDPSVREIRGFVRQILLESQARGELRPEADLETVTRLLESAYFAAIFHWLTHTTSTRAFRRDLDLTLEIIFRGIGAGPETGRRRS